MSHIAENKNIISRIRRIKGQLDAVEKGITEKKDCFAVLQTLAACKGAMNGLFGELVEGHIQEHIINIPDEIDPNQRQAALELIKLLKMYWK
ncbi:metal/formaldehyde-sensitive transcriptional repressor [Francisellaceae bacterium]|jgi:DNA-binding FrmR family transcriptional regulator|nr:metal/formaldehyde-sensitive transcriptional repressor [Francisellaceae bacterium]